MRHSVLLSNAMVSSVVAVTTGPSTPTAAAGILIAGMSLPQILAIAMTAAALWLLFSMAIRVTRYCLDAPTTSLATGSLWKTSQEEGKTVELFRMDNVHCVRFIPRYPKKPGREPGFGYGTLERDGYRYEGQVKNGVPDGYGTLTFIREQCVEIFNGSFCKGQLTRGIMNRIAKEGFSLSLGSCRSYEGEWKNGLPHGRGATTYVQAAEAALPSLVENTGRLYDYTGEFQEGRVHGQGMARLIGLADGSKGFIGIEGSFKDGHLTGDVESTLVRPKHGSSNECRIEKIKLVMAELEPGVFQVKYASHAPRSTPPPLRGQVSVPAFSPEVEVSSGLTLPAQSRIWTTTLEAGRTEDRCGEAGTDLIRFIPTEPDNPARILGSGHGILIEAGFTYEGEVKNGVPHGNGKKGLLHQDYSEIYEGEFLNGVFTKGCLERVEMVPGSIPVGGWKRYNGSWCGGLPHGNNGTVTFVRAIRAHMPAAAQDSLRCHAYQGAVENGQLNGIGKLILSYQDRDGEPFVSIKGKFANGAVVDGENYCVSLPSQFDQNLGRFVYSVYNGPIALVGQYDAFQLYTNPRS